MRAIILLNILFCFLISCEESKVACLDFYAENFNFGAVNSCDSCCVYPDVDVSFNLVIDTIDYQLNDKFSNDLSDTFSISSFQLLFSSFRFIDADSSFRIRNRVDDNTNIVDDYYLFRSNRLTERNLGQSSFESEFVRLEFTLGLDEDLISSLKPFNSLFEESSLKLAVDSTYDSLTDKFKIFRMEFELNDSLYAIHYYNDQAKQLNFELDEMVLAGRSWQLDMSYDFKKLFLGVNSQQNIEENELIIIDNLSQSITIQ